MKIKKLKKKRKLKTIYNKRSKLRLSVLVSSRCCFSFLLECAGQRNCAFENNTAYNN